jgi:hypothetical protein
MLVAAASALYKNIMSEPVRVLQSVTRTIDMTAKTDHKINKRNLDR